MNVLRSIGVGLLGMMLVGLVGCGSNPAAKINQNAPTGTGMKLKTARINGGDVKYSVFIPHGYRSEQQWPTIVFLHGIGEAGSSGTAPTTVGLGPQIAKDPGNFNFIVVFPQVSGSWAAPEKQDRVVEVLDDVAKQYSIDPERVYLTGLSTGGQGVWLTGARHRNRFAALVPMCGYDAMDAVPGLTDIPIWCFHNSGDWAVGAGDSRRMVEAIKAAGNPHIKYTQYSAFGHDVWIKAFNDPELYRWMLQQRRR